MNRFIAVLLVASVAAITVVTGAGAEQTYSDPTGDAGAGTDIASVTVRNDLSGLVTIHISSASPIVGNHAVAVFIDADRNGATGDDGIEAWMFGGPLVGAAFMACNSAGCSPASPPGFSARAAGTNVTEFQFDRSAIANTTSFDFDVVSISIDPPNVNFWDVAGTFTYDLVFPQCSNGKDDDADGRVDAQDLGCSSATDDNEADDPVNVRLGKAKAKPASPRAGSVVAITARTTRVETGQPLESGSVSCTGSYPGGKKLRGSGSVVAGDAICRIKVPAGASGKTVRGSLTVKYKTATATAAFSVKVR